MLNKYKIFSLKLNAISLRDELLIGRGLWARAGYASQPIIRTMKRGYMRVLPISWRSSVHPEVKVSFVQSVPSTISSGKDDASC